MSKNKCKIKVGLLNVQNGIGTTKGYWQYLFHMPKYFFPHNSKKIIQIGKLVRNEEIDIFATAEIEKGSTRTKNIDQVELLAQNSNLKNFAYFPALVWKKRINQGNAIHTHFEILDQKNYRLPGTGEPRHVGKAKIKINNKIITFFVTHLDLNFLHRKAQIKKLSWLINRSKNPIILAGDFNIFHEDELELIEKSKLRKVYTAKTFPVWKPKKRLDYIFASEEIRIGEGKVCKKSLSDHCALTVEMFV